MTITNYSELKSNIADWLLRSDLTGVIPAFVSNAEAQLNREVRDHRMVKRATADVDSQYFTKPTDWMETIRFQLNTSPSAPLEFVTPDEAAELAARNTSTGKPKYFTHIGTELELVPTPDASYTAELTYYSEIPSLSDDNTTNWLLTSNPDIYLYGSLMQAAPYLNDDARLATWRTLYREGVESLKVQDQRARIGSSSLRMRLKPMA